MAVIFALVAVPLLGLVSASIDFSSVLSEKQSVKGALDAAVIAAVNNNAIPLDEKDAFAKAFFEANYDGRADLTLTAVIEESEVVLAANGTIELSFGQLIGMDDPIVGARSAAKIATENTICLMSLNETDARSILFDGGINYASPSCSVYSNSSNGSAIYSTASYAPEAKSFCAVGGAYGDFLPYAKGECKTLDDPYASTPAPIIPSACTVPKSDLIVLKDESIVGSDVLMQMQRDLFEARLASAFSVFQQTQSLRAAVDDFFSFATVPVYDTDASRTLQVSENRTGSYVDIKPGTFCGGLTIDGIDVDFLPGEYIIKDGPLSFINGAEAVAEGVTFVLAGEGAVLNIQSQAQLSLRAPNSGARKGLAVMEAVDKSEPGNRTVDTQRSLVSGGGSLKVTGVVYLPEQTLEIRGQGTSVGSMAPATGFIADKLHIGGTAGAKMVVSVDHQSENVPPIQPRSEDGARLTR